MATEKLNVESWLLPSRITARNEPLIINGLRDQARKMRERINSLDPKDAERKRFQIRAALRERLAAWPEEGIAPAAVLQEFKPAPGTELDTVAVDILALGCFGESGKWPLIDEELGIKPPISN